MNLPPIQIGEQQKSYHISELKTLALLLKFFFQQDQKTAIFKQLHSMKTPHSDILSIFCVAEEVLRLGDTNEVYKTTFQQLRQVELLLKQMNFSIYQLLMYNMVCRSFQSALLFLMGEVNYANQLANDAAQAFAQQLQMQDHYILWFQLIELEWVIKVHVSSRAHRMLFFDINQLETILCRALTRNAFIPKQVITLLNTCKTDYENITSTIPITPSSTSTSPGSNNSNTPNTPVSVSEHSSPESQMGNETITGDYHTLFDTTISDSVHNGLFDVPQLVHNIALSCTESCFPGEFITG